MRSCSLRYDIEFLNDGPILSKIEDKVRHALGRPVDQGRDITMCYPLVQNAHLLLQKTQDDDGQDAVLKASTR